ncbi:ATP-binding cassette domain-containing protein [Segetibacter aerophilus]|uniref:Molybdenum ABC transporter ATP-binding protein n=1 Tax=Segetibacter aerophilus TaxID=670293 RepID=A0A512BGA4_9BACT|nr:ATP-binding cassette domain-containing protein [Segetibacter aerophilus]GEO10998.1 molybdenum ABC transporter ATP-binding protein [Segetibacter aerophilus]
MEVLKADSVTVKHGGQTILNQLSFSIQQGEQWAIVGPAGSGKTTLLKALTGRQHFTGHVTLHENNLTLTRKIVLVEQQHHFKNLSNTTNFYYQQRFNSQDAEDAITVEEDLQKTLTATKSSLQGLDELAELFNIKKLFTERLIQLSNGENKRLQIVKALLLQPAFLLLDNPFTGLDVKSRQKLEEVLDEIGKKGIHIILVTSATHLPFFITNVLFLSKDGSYITEPVNAVEWNDTHATKAKVSFDHELLRQLTLNNKHASFELAVKMKDVNIEYDHKILDNINWEVKNGERWSLSGPNGSGKSTLLSLVNADNPQAYANDIYLFDRKRGSGESIWDIKKKTGFVSPELHLYFEKGTNCFDVVASGLFDTIGLFRKINQQQSALVIRWMQLLKIESLQRKFLNQLSNSEQRLVLLARALVKNPPLLILDEPCQGLDEEQTLMFKEIINAICVAGNKTLIYVSHYADEIPACVTHFIKLENGKQVE